MKFKQILSSVLILIMLCVLCSCNTETNINSMPQNNSQPEDTTSYNELPDIISLDKKMANYFDISLFDEENYSKIYLGKNFKFDITYNDKKLTIPTTIEKLEKQEFHIADESEYDSNSYIFAKETINLKFFDFNSSFSALFYNPSNSSIKLSKCNITKIRLENNLNTRNIVLFNVNGIDNYSTVTDVIDQLGTPSHFYAISENLYYFDYFISKEDRRNKIRVFVDLEDDFVTAIEFSYYK